jgi:hypothetical protein
MPVNFCLRVIHPADKKDAAHHPYNSHIVSAVMDTPKTQQQTGQRILMHHAQATCRRSIAVATAAFSVSASTGFTK